MYLLRKGEYSCRIFLPNILKFQWCKLVMNIYDEYFHRIFVLQMENTSDIKSSYVYLIQFLLFVNKLFYSVAAPCCYFLPFIKNFPVTGLSVVP